MSSDPNPSPKHHKPRKQFTRPRRSAPHAKAANNDAQLMFCPGCGATIPESLQLCPVCLRATTDEETNR